MQLIIPIFLFITVLYGLMSKIDVYETFVKGVSKGMKLVIKIFPIYLAMIFATKLLIASNFFNHFLNFIKISFAYSNEILLQGILRPISGSSSFSLMIEIYEKFGVDSKIGILSSIMQGSTDTTLYIISLYFGSVGIIHYKKAIYLGLLVDIVGFIASILIITYML